jgi:arsenate reductase (thioredoxin)
MNRRALSEVPAIDRRGNSSARARPAILPIERALRRATALGYRSLVSTSPTPPAFISEPPRRVAFLCTRNSARSQMAEGFARSLAPAEVEVWSAGHDPGAVHPFAVQVMRELGIELAGQSSKSIDAIPLQEADTVVTLCGDADEVCPVVRPEVRRVHWPLPDPVKAPEGERLQKFREVRDEIRWRVASLWPRSG